VSTRRTTLAADRDDLALLEEEARRQGISLARLLRELVAKEATDLRRRRRPRFGVVSMGGVARASVEDEEAPIVDRGD
jgi:Ribbon-helix-helix protein, copG family